MWTLLATQVQRAAQAMLSAAVELIQDPCFRKGVHWRLWLLVFVRWPSWRSLSLSDQVELENKVPVRVGDRKSTSAFESGDGDREAVRVDYGRSLGNDGFCNQWSVLGS